MATCGFSWFAPLSSLAISGPSREWDTLLYIWARMSLSMWVVEDWSVQTATARPVDELALSEKNWALRVVVLTRNSLPSDRSCRPSRASRAGRLRCGWRDRSADAE